MSEFDFNGTEDLYGKPKRKPKRKLKDKSRALAGAGQRFGAYIIDTILMGVVSNIISGSMTVFYRGETNSDSYIYTMLLLTMLLTLTYHALLPVIWDGQTVGKRALNIRIVRLNGHPITLWSMILRNVIGYWLSGTFMSLGFLWILFDERNQGWHDKLAGTIVVRG